MRLSFVFLITCFLTTFCFGQVDCEHNVAEEPPNTDQGKNCNNQAIHFQNAPLEFHAVPFKEVNLMIHIVRDIDGLQNYQETPTDIAKINALVDGVNQKFANLQMQNPLGPCTPPSEHIPDSKIQFHLNAIKFYEHAEYYCSDVASEFAILHNHFVVNNPDLTQEEKTNNLHIIIVAYRGSGPNRDDCDNPVTWLGGVGLRNGDYCAVRNYYTESSFEKTVGHLSHEIGHALGLSHSWADSMCDTGGGQRQSNNIMDYTSNDDDDSNDRFAFTQRQLAYMHFWIENRQGGQPYLRNDLCDKQSTKIVIPQGTEVHWETDEIVSEDVEIYGNLKITCEVQVANGVKFTVFRGGKLQVDGGHIFGCNEWQGIIVEGDAEHLSQANAGEVEFTNQAIIEDAINAVSMKPIHIPWPETPKYYGGLVTAIDANFINCRRAVQFMKYGTGIIKDKSSFTNCTFDGMKYAITIWANNGVTIDNCHFTNITEYAVHPYNSSVTIENGCLFENMPMGVNILYTFPQPLAPQIGNQNNQSNDFNCTEYGIHSTSAGSTDPLTVVNNNFLGGQTGIEVSGHGYFEIHHNDLLSYTNTFAEEPAAVSTVSTGYWPNRVFENNIYSNRYGSRAVGDNPGLRYTFNCFDFNTSVDIWIADGMIHPFQHGFEYDTNESDTTEAGNCFSKGGIPEIDNSNNPPIRYYVNPDLESMDCRYLDASLNVTQNDANVANINANCGSQNSPGGTNIVGFCGGPFKSKQEIKDRIASIEAYIQQIEQTNYPSETYKQFLLSKYQRCLDKLLALIGVVIMDPKEEPADDPDGVKRMEEYITYYRARPEFNYQIMAYGMMIQLNDLTRARTYLNSLVANTEEKQDFVWAQQIYLDYLADPFNYVLDTTDESVLFTKARKFFPLAGYSRAVYEVLMEKKVDMDLPSRGSAPRSAVITTSDLQIHSFPNPASDTYSVLLSGGDDQTIYQGQLIDGMGRSVRTFQLNNADRADISVSNLQNGVYILVIQRENGKRLHSSKVVILR